MMGDAADDAFDAAFARGPAERTVMQAWGCTPCPNCRLSARRGEVECPVCRDLGWLDENNQPCESQ